MCVSVSLCSGKIYLHVSIYTATAENSSQETVDWIIIQKFSTQ